MIRLKRRRTFLKGMISGSIDIEICYGFIHQIATMLPNSLLGAITKSNISRIRPQMISRITNYLTENTQDRRFLTSSKDLCVIKITICLSNRIWIGSLKKMNVRENRNKKSITTRFSPNCMTNSSKITLKNQMFFTFYHIFQMG